MHELLSKIESPLRLHEFSLSQLNQVADEIRDVLCQLLSTRTAHFASNLGVVELCLALHSTFDFRHDRLIWDTGHQIYPHKLVTGRYREFGTLRTRGGLMGYPNPRESEYDLFMTGHAGCSVSTVMGISSGDVLLGHQNRHAVAVIGDGALPSGIVFEAFNNVCCASRNLLVVLNDNKMSICPRVGGIAHYLDRLRTNPFYTGLKEEIVRALNKVPVLGDTVERFLAQTKEGIKAGVHGGMLFEELGFHYLGPIEGHDIGLLREYLALALKIDAPVLLHVLTEKGHGFQPAAQDPVYFHTPPAFQQRNGQPAPAAGRSPTTYTNCARDAILQQMNADPRVTVFTAAMCQGNKLEPVRDQFPDRFFDTGICESHTVAFAAGQAKAGLRPIVNIYSTFLQRAFDQIFQEVALQQLPVVFMVDRAGLTGPDGPTHHGVFDLAYLRIFPGMTLMVPGDTTDIGAMLELALKLDGPNCIRYPKAKASREARPGEPVRLGKADVRQWGCDCMIIACGTLLADCLAAADRLRQQGLDVGVVNARFVKPLDEAVVARAMKECHVVVTVEEAVLVGGFASAVLEAASRQRWDTRKLHCMGLPDRFIEHGDRAQVLAELGLDANGIALACRELIEREQSKRCLNTQP